MPMRTFLASELLGSTRTSLEPSADSNDPVDFLASGVFFGNLLPEGGEFFGGDDGRGVIAAFNFALVSTLEGGVDGDDPTGARHL